MSRLAADNALREEQSTMVYSTTSISFTDLTARTILDSRGHPTIEVRVTLADGTQSVASAPAGASTGKHEAAELRDNDRAFDGRGVLSAIHGVETEVKHMLIERSWEKQSHIDTALRQLDGTDNYSRLGANAVVAVSIATSRAMAHSRGSSVYEFIAEQSGTRPKLPVPHFNVLNGGEHASNALDFQEFMIAPVGAKDEGQAVQIGSEIYHSLARLVHHRYGSVGLGDEGGFAPQIEDPREALDLLVDAISAAGYSAARDEVAIAIDPAANSFSLGNGRYRINGIERDRDGTVEYYKDLVDAYPIRSLEDGCAEDDREGWIALSQALGNTVQLVGDDLYVTDPARILDGAENGYSNAVLIKPNQIGTVTETLQAIATAREWGMACMVSHRSGETDDTFIADLAVGAGTGQIKSGAPARGERVAKYNRLTEIERDGVSIPYGLS